MRKFDYRDYRSPCLAEDDNNSQFQTEEDEPSFLQKTRGGGSTSRIVNTRMRRPRVGKTELRRTRQHIGSGQYPVQLPWHCFTVIYFGNLMQQNIPHALSLNFPTSRKQNESGYNFLQRKRKRVILKLWKRKGKRLIFKTWKQKRGNF